MDDRRPRFRPVRRVEPPASVEDLFYGLRGRREHEFLRGPQQDVIRDYDVTGHQERNVAIELPTGTGKTTVGLLIAEWWRLQNQRPVAFLTLTNQLAHQVLTEATKLGVTVADVTGSAAERDPAAEGLYRSAEAIGISTYSNLFNVNPVISGSDLLILDDVHGGEQYAASMWTITLERNDAQDLYMQVLTALAPAMTPRQHRLLTTDAGLGHQDPHLIDISNSEAAANITRILEPVALPRVRFPWSLVGGRLESCLVIASRSRITIRPYVTPTWSHAPFQGASQRIFLSATLGGSADLRRAYGVSQPRRIQAKHVQSGRRYIFVPEMFAAEARANEFITELWSRIQPRRALILAPSKAGAASVAKNLASSVTPSSVVLDADDIAESLASFTESDNALLALGGRYDGIDLPHNQCRLLIMAGNPISVSDVETLLSSQWSASTVLRQKSLTRLIQGLGRCTRGDSDYALVIWLGQGLVDVAGNRSLMGRMPPNLRAELASGVEQSKILTEAQGAGSLTELAVSLLNDPDLRSEAETVVTELEEDERHRDVQHEPYLDDLEAAVAHEIVFGERLWGGDYSGAYEAARQVADKVVSEGLQGYRAFWMYLAASCALKANALDNARDSLRRALACNVNRAFIAEMSTRTGTSAAPQELPSMGNVQGVLKYLDDVGWAGPRFENAASMMLDHLGETVATQFHMGIQELGALLGADAVRETTPGAPDVVWAFEEVGVFITLEAKSEKEPGGSLSKSDLQEANGHSEWVKSRYPSAAEDGICKIVVSPVSSVGEVARPFVEDLFYLSLDELREFAQETCDHMRELRAQLAGVDADRARILGQELTQRSLDTRSVVGRFRGTPLREVMND